MIYTSSNTYARFISDLDSRLDFLHYHPDLDVLKELPSLTPYNVCDLGTLLLDEDGIVSGTTPSGIKYSQDGVPFLGATNIKNGQLSLSALTCISHEQHEGVLASSRLQRGDV